MKGNCNVTIFTKHILCSPEQSQLLSLVSGEFKNRNRLNTNVEMFWESLHYSSMVKRKYFLILFTDFFVEKCQTNLRKGIFLLPLDERV